MRTVCPGFWKRGFLNRGLIMIKLAKCCQTCAYAQFFADSNTSLCAFHTKELGYSIEVRKPYTCEHYLNAQKGTKLSTGNKPTKRLVYWLNSIKKLNQFIWEKSKDT